MVLHRFDSQYRGGVLARGACYSGQVRVKGGNGPERGEFFDFLSRGCKKAIGEVSICREKAVGIWITLMIHSVRYPTSLSKPSAESGDTASITRYSDS